MREREKEEGLKKRGMGWGRHDLYDYDWHPLFTMPRVRVRDKVSRYLHRNSYWLSFSWRKTRQAFDSEQSFVWGLTSVDVYFWKLRKWKYISPPALPVWIWQTQTPSLPFCASDGTWNEQPVLFSTAPQDSLSTDPSRGKQPVITQKAKRGLPRTPSKIRWKSPPEGSLIWLNHMLKGGAGLGRKSTQRRPAFSMGGDLD